MLTQTQHPTTQAHTTKAAAEVRELIASLHKLESVLKADNLDLTALSAAKDDIKAKHSGLALSLRQTHDSACRSLKLHLEALPIHEVFNTLFAPAEAGYALDSSRIWVRRKGRDICAVIGAVLAALGRRVASPFNRHQLARECDVFCELTERDAISNRRCLCTHYSLRPEYQALLTDENISFLRTFIAEAGLPQGLANR